MRENTMKAHRKKQLIAWCEERSAQVKDCQRLRENFPTGSGRLGRFL
jgi:hypothetical protein